VLNSIIFRGLGGRGLFGLKRKKQQEMRLLLKNQR